jgi:hypothetical protein
MCVESLIALGLSASTAATVGTAASIAGTAVAGAAATSALAKTPKVETPKPLTQADKPQAKQEVDRSTILKRNATAAMGALSGNSSTLLSGTGGVSAGSLNLGGNSLLGS